MRRSLIHPARLCPTRLCKALALGAALLAAGPAAASIAWVSNEKDNSLSLIDMQSLEVIETLPVGQRPGACCCPTTIACCTSAPATRTGSR